MDEADLLALWPWLISLAGADAPPDPPWTPPAPIVGGAPASIDRWPAMAALYSPDFFVCGGILIAPDTVLTAAHCAYNLDQVVLGAADHTLDGERIAVEGITWPPDPDGRLDLALVHLAAPSTRSPARLPPPCLVEAFLTEGAPVQVLGYGAIDPEGLEWTTELHGASTVVIDPLCADPEKGCYEELSPGGELIAGGEGVDSCSGDSGGPLFLTEPGDWLVGITSRGVRSVQTCGQGGIYVRVDAARSWIEAELGQTLGPPDCEGINLPPILATPEPLRVAPASLTHRFIEATDPDPTDRLSFALAQPAPLGFAHIDPDSGRLSYAAPPTPGQTTLQIVVRDDGDPPRSAQVQLPILIHGTSSASRASCAHLPAAPLLALCLAFLGMRRRR